MGGAKRHSKQTILRVKKNRGDQMTSQRRAQPLRAGWVRTKQMDAPVHVEPRIVTLLQQLHVVASLQPHEKLSLSKSSGLSVHAPGTFTAATRLLSGDSRNNTVDAVHEIVRELGGLLLTLSDLLRAGHEQHSTRLAEWTREMYSCWTGLETLKQTYAGDTGVVARLGTVQKEVDRIVDVVEAATGRGCVTRRGVTLD